MNRNKLETYLGKKVEVTIFNGNKYKGELHKTREIIFEKEPNLYMPNNRYFLINPDLPMFNCCQSCLFRCSHVKKIEKL